MRCGWARRLCIWLLLLLLLQLLGLLLVRRGLLLLRPLARHNELLRLRCCDCLLGSRPLQLLLLPLLLQAGQPRSLHCCGHISRLSAS